MAPAVYLLSVTKASAKVTIFFNYATILGHFFDFFAFGAGKVAQRVAFLWVAACRDGGIE